MATGSVRAPGKSYKGHFLFEERDELWWISGKDVSLARSHLGLRCYGERVGFDPAAGKGYARLLVAQGIQVDLRRGDKTFNLNNRLRDNGRAPLMCRLVWMDPQLLLPASRLAELRRRVSCDHPSNHDLAERLQEALSLGRSRVMFEFGKLYVYEVEPNTYEIDWRLSTVQPDIFETMAAVASGGGHKLPCHLVLPKGQRVGPRGKERPVLMSERKPNGRGQLQLLF